MAIKRAIEFLRAALGAGPLPADDVRARAKAAGLSWASLRRAKPRIGIVALRESKSNTGEGKWLWSLPVSQEVRRQEAQPAQTAQAVPAPPATAPPRMREIIVRRPGVAAVGPDQVTWADWQALGCSTERLKLFLRQRDQQAVQPGDN
jgi:hypothetical protein